MTDQAPHACARRWSKAIERSFVGKLSTRRYAELRDHVSACEPCRAAYDRLAHLERAIHGDVFPAPARARAKKLALGTSRPRLRWVLAPAGALAAAVAALLLWSGTSDELHGRAEFRARGTQAQIEPWVSGDREPGVRLFCVELSDSGARVRDEVHMGRGSMPPPELRCTLDDELQVAYSTPNLSGLRMSVFARSQFGATTGFAPPEAGGSPISLTRNAIDEPLAWSTRLAADHRIGSYEVSARFYLDLASAASAAPIADLRANLVIEESEEVTP